LGLLGEEIAMQSLVSKDPEVKLVESAMLLDVYGSLLTERQRTFMRLHFEEDLSFSQIAREFSISRQAVHDSVKHALDTLMSLESALHLVERSKASHESPEGGPHLGGRQLVERLERLLGRVVEVENACGEKGAGLADEVRSLIGLLRGNGGAVSPASDSEVAPGPGTLAPPKA
jgi:predicted DNA-binding protein YlxM (UPF0122 family)